MVANVRGYTPNYGFKLINFDTPRWHTLEYANWSQLDSMFLQFGASGIRGQWLNSTEYLVGERVFDETNGLLYRCLVQHISAATGTFAEDRTANPTYWSIQLGGVPVFRGDWLSGTAYAQGDIVAVNDYEYFLCTSPHIADALFPGNGAQWQTIFDATEVVTDAQAAADIANSSASSASASASNAATSEQQAEAAAEAAADSAYLASSSQGAFRWNFDTNTSMADPGIADLQFNNTDWTQVTSIAISAQTADLGNPDVSGWIASWDDSTNANRGTLYMREASSPENFVIFNIIGALTDNGTWLLVPVEYVNHLGNYAVGDPISVSFSRTGNTGSSGAGTGDLLSTNNLSDVQSIPTSIENLGLGPTDTPEFTQIIVANPPTQDDHVVTRGYLNQSPSLIISDTPPVGVQPGALWWESDAGMLYVYYDDGQDAPQWVQAVAIPSPNLANYVQKSGDVMSGALVLSGNPIAALDAAPKQYVDASIGTIIPSFSLAATVAGNALTVSLKTLSGADPSPANPIKITFRSSNPANGTYTTLAIIAPLSLTISSGSKCGFADGGAGRLWVAVFNDAGIAKLAVINCLYRGSVLTPQIYPLRDNSVANAVAEGGAGAADNSSVFYSTTNITSAAFRVAGHLTWNTPMPTAGLWSAIPDVIEAATPNMKMPGDVVQLGATNSASGSTSSASYVPIPSTAIQLTPTSAANLFEVTYTGSAIATAGGAGTNTYHSSSLTINGSSLSTLTIGTVSASGTNVQAQGTIAFHYIRAMLSMSTHTAELQHANTGSPASITASNICGSFKELVA